MTMGRLLALLMLAAMSPVSAFAQEVTGGKDIKTMPTDTVPITSEAPSGLITRPKDTPSFLQDKTFRPEKPKDLAAEKRSDAQSFKVDDNALYAPPAPYFIPFTHDPLAYDFATGGVLASWKRGMILGMSSRRTMSGLLSDHGASLSVTQTVGNLTLTGGLLADRYLLWKGSRTVFGVNGAMTFNFSDRVSATLFGRYYAGNSFYSMAAMPYFGSSGYGGYLTFTGRRLGVDLGVERYYDTFAGRWVTSPIITPKIRFSDRFTLDIPVGHLVKEVVDDKLLKRGRKANPTIMPHVENMPSPVPFGAPEMPR